MHPRLGRTRVQIYYNVFERNQNYCVDVKATKFFDVKDIQNAGVIVYDYRDKGKLQCCRSMGHRLDGTLSHCYYYIMVHR